MVKAIRGAILFGVMALSQVGAWAGPLSAEEITRVLAEVLQPFQDDNTRAEIAVPSLTTNAAGVLDSVRMTGFFEKHGPENSLGLRINELTYDERQAVPTSRVDIVLQSNSLVKVLGQELVNDIGQSVREALTSSFEDWVPAELKPATTITVKVDRMEFAGDNFVAAKGEITYTIDPTKVPEGASLLYETVLNAKIRFDADTTKIAVQMDIGWNRDSEYFQAGSSLVKEAAQALAAGEPDTFATVKDLVGFVNEISGELVNPPAQEQP